MRIKGRKAMKVLELIGGAALETTDIWLAIVTSPYGSSHGRIQRQKEKVQRAREELISELKEKQSLLSLIKNFKRDDLIAKKEKRNGKNFWQLTPKGEKELGRLKIYYGKNSLPERKYESETSEGITIIAFDIPEKERSKRDWLRRKLIEMKFKKLQGSVWVGKLKVPEVFIGDLNVCKLLPCVEIFTVSKTGSLRKLPL